MARNWKAMREIVNMIIMSPAHWDQDVWHSPCGSRHCFAGFADLINPDVQVPEGHEWDERFNVFHSGTRRRAVNFLGLNATDADWLFDSSATFDQIYTFVETQGEKHKSRKDAYANPGMYSLLT